jgi:PAS domain S-box-containing protein
MDSNGQVTHAVFLSEDITEQKGAEKKLIESEQSYRSLIEQAKDGIVLIQDGHIKYANSSMAEFSGYSVDELLNRPFEKFVADDQIEKVREIYRNRMKNEPVPAIYESAINHKNGTRLETEFNAGVTTHRGKPADLVIVRDIRERKKAEEERSRLFRLSQDLIVIAGFDGYLKQLNPAWEAVLGYSSDELMAKPFLDFIQVMQKLKNCRQVTRQLILRIVTSIKTGRSGIFPGQPHHCLKKGSSTVSEETLPDGKKPRSKSSTTSRG